MLRLHWATFSPRPYHVLKIQERGEDGVKMKQFRISKFPLRPYYVPATSLLRPHHVLTTSFKFPLRPQYALTKFIPFPLRRSLLRPHKDQAVHTTRELRFQHGLTVNILIRILYILLKTCLVCSYPFLPYSQPKTVISFVLRPINMLRYMGIEHAGNVI